MTYSKFNSASRRRSNNSFGGSRSSRPAFRSGSYRPRPGGRPQGRGQYIHPDKFIKKATVQTPQTQYVAEHTFSDFGLLPQIQTNLATQGFTAPTPIQDKAIKPILEGRDFIGLANTGTGKTAAFVLPLINRLKTMPAGQTALIVAPTRELATQIDDDFRLFAHGLNLYSAICVGGMHIGHQIRSLARHPQVVIGTPGRLKDLLNRRVLKLDKVSILVLDEADRMLDMGFLPEIRMLISHIPTKPQSLCFSATITPPIQRLLDDMLQDPATASVSTSDTSENIDQDVIRASKDQKFTVLHTLLQKPDFDKVLIFGQTKWGVQRLAENLTKEGVRAEAIHGNKTQPQRQRALQAFKAGDVAVLVATDVAARGLDIPNVSHVINFDQPASYQDYIHRIGRTGRAGKLGQALTFV